MIRPTSRPYCDAEDLQSMLDLLVAVRPAGRITDSPSLVDLRELLALRSVQDNTRLWFGENDQLVAFALVDPYHNLRFEVDPSAADPDLGSEIVAWGDACLRRAMPDGDRSLTLDASCREDDRQRIAWLARYGFVQQALRTLHLVRPLQEPIARPQLPDGFCLRPVAGDQEVEVLVTLHRAAFGTEQMTVEERLAMMRGPEYDPALDLLIAGPGGRPVAYCLCSISHEENARTGRKEGYIDPVATHPDFRRQGLARALLLTGLEALKQRGMDNAVSGTSSENVAMLHTAQSVGFRVQSTTRWFSRMANQSHPQGRAEP